MPPRYAYWTIIIDDAPTAFRARERQELLPTFRQLVRRNPNAVMKWFAKGRLWESPEEARAATRPRPEPRGPDWRPGGRHQDPRARFDKRAGRRDRPKAEKQQGTRGARSRQAREAGARGKDRRPWPSPGSPGGPGPQAREHGRRRTPFPPQGTAKRRASDKQNEPEPPTPTPPPGPDRPPKPGEEPRPDRSEPETIRILPEPPERAK